MKGKAVLYTFNRGIVSPLALARQDLAKMGLSAETQTNWMPRTLGPMMLRPGTSYLHTISTSAATVHIPFVFSQDSKALLECTNLLVRPVVSDAYITVPDLSSTSISNGQFQSLTNWTGVDEANGVSSIVDLGGGTHRYWRIYITESTAPDNIIRGYEAEFRGSVGGPDQCTGGTASASHNSSTAYKLFNDNGASDYWISNTSPSMPCWFQYDFGSGNAVAVAEWGFMPGNSGSDITQSPKAFSLQWSDDGTSFTTLKSWSDVTSWTAGVQKLFAIDNVTTYLNLISSDGLSYAGREQLITGSALEHFISITVLKGVAILSVGRTSAGEELIPQMTLREGKHVIAFTPHIDETYQFYLRLKANRKTATQISDVSIVYAGNLSIVSPWATADLKNIRYDQSGDVVFVACDGVQQYRIERQYSPTAMHSWSIVKYLTEDGPFLPENLGAITMAPAALNGSTTLTASKPYFLSTNAGSLFRVSSIGQSVEVTITTDETWSDPIKVTGIDDARKYYLTITGTWSGTVRIQRSVGDIGDWGNVSSFTTNTTANERNDTLDNQIIYYRVGVDATGHTSGTIVASLSYAVGSIDGICRVTSVTSSTVAQVDILKPFGKTTASSEWSEGQWSTRRGFPSAVVLHDGRLWWAGKNVMNGSVSDTFNSFDSTVEGDSGPILRSIGSGPVDKINWMLSLGTLLVGTQGKIFSAKSSSLDEPLTPSQFTLKPVSTLGSTDIQAVMIDISGVFVHRNGSRVYELSLADGYSYSAGDLTAIVPEIGESPFLRVVVQRIPDTRIHCVRTDGTVAIMIRDRLEDVSCWIEYETDGVVEDAVVLPGTVEDQVYYVVARNINSSTVRFLERWALESEGKGTATTVLTDASVTKTQSASATVTGLTHLIGETVKAWDVTDSKELAVTGVVNGSGQITVSETTVNIIVGLPYTATFKSSKLALGLGLGVSLTQRQRLDHVGLVMLNTHAQGLQYGQEASYMDELPLIEDGTTVTSGSVWGSYSEDSVHLNGTWSTDTRLILTAASPKCCTILAAVVSGGGNEK
jgi:hypothetical protein